ncbi:glycine oxidase ThiO [Sulfoacidibacillus thermotolerans]|uniref:glycine oxidase n=1 Tax=Sulfoacidibacillus thermotolerans TaxID=1765684 RepID=A0A2U3D6K7_SULT2|nr:glycine oxidase ThiO [Sulfoacidibacillus thermotolerans]PWI56909.1 glycine oxidase ThiO [Sulfoacidibacillus thermotolerans]
MKTSYDVIVVGGGVIGSTIAWRIAQTSRKVLLLERGRLGQEASSAAAGMLGAELEMNEPGPFFQLCLESRELYPTFSDELFDLTGIEIELTPNGILRLARTTEEAAQLQETAAWQQLHGGSAMFLTSTQIAAMETSVCETFGGLFLAKDGNVNAALVTRAVGKAASLTADVIEGSPVYDIVFSPTEVTVRTATEQYHAEKVILANGAFANQFLPSMHMPPSLIPVKGQLLRIQPSGHVKLTRTISHGHFYFVPKRDGTIIVGATEEPELLSHINTVSGLSQLLLAVQDVLPGLRDAAFVDAWTGIRPLLPTREPFIGPVDANSQALVAIGHFRNGILLAPVTAEIIVSLIEGKALLAHHKAFIPQIPVSQVR